MARKKLENRRIKLNNNIKIYFFSKIKIKNIYNINSNYKF